MEDKSKMVFKPTVMITTVVLFALMLVFVVIDAEAFYNFLSGMVMGFLMTNVGWAVSLTMLFMVALCVFIMFSPMGKIKLGGKDAKPNFTNFQWFGIALCTGIGAGVVFWGAAEPLLFAMEPSPSTGFEPGSNEAVLWSMLHSFLQWGLTPYSSCVIMGIVISYAILNMGAPFKPSACLVPMFGTKVLETKWCDIFDSISAVALTGAVAGGLGYGAMQLSAGVEAFAGVQPTTMMYIVIIALMFIAYNASAISGLKKGITLLSGYNTKLFFVMMGFVFLTGPTAYICNLFTESLGEYFSEFFSASLYTAPYPDSESWPQNWDMYWWVDWMAYAPLLGLFMARISKGRTLRQFVLVQWILPALFGVVWFSVFGGTILNAQLYDGVDFYSLYLENGAEALTIGMFDVLPFSEIAQVIMLIIITISLITQADSMAVTLSGMCLEGSTEDTEAPIKLKLFWGIAFAVIAVVFIVLGGIDGVKTVKSFFGIPLTFICLFIILGFLRYMAKRPRNLDGSYMEEPHVSK